MIQEAMLARTLGNREVDCLLCSHACRIAPDKKGICAVRVNREGKLYTTLYGDLAAVHVDPIEKKPLFHFLPGSLSFSIATMGCNFQCSFCQNWQISQTPRTQGKVSGAEISPEEVVAAALARECSSISYTYTEPTIFFEYAYDTAFLAKKEDLANIFVTNGYMTAKALKTIHPYLDACNVDLKSFRDDFYRKICHARLNPVLESIRLMKELGIWLEITTLVVPGLNDSDNELRDIASFIAGVDRNIPWHISRFHPDYEYGDGEMTPLPTLHKAARIGTEAGIRYIYIGNVWGEDMETQCAACGKTVISRAGYSRIEVVLKDSACPFCGTSVAGVFHSRKG